MPAGQGSIVRVVENSSVTVVLGTSVRVVPGINGTAAGVVITGFAVTRGVAKGTGVRVGSAVWKVYFGEVVETLTGAFVATCRDAARTRNSGGEYLSSAICTLAVSSPGSIAVQGAGTREMDTRQNTKNRIAVFWEEISTGAENTDIQEPFSRE